MVQDVYDISDLVGAGDSNITDAEIVEEARGIKNLIMATIESYTWNERNPDASGTIIPYPAEKPTKLNISHTIVVHNEIKKLLDIMRPSSDEELIPDALVKP